jgi:hypothetical protein
VSFKGIAPAEQLLKLSGVLRVILVLQPGTGID